MDYVQYHSEPELRDPVVVAALAGWNDAGFGHYSNKIPDG